MVIGTSWGLGIAQPKSRLGRKWDRIRQRELGAPAGLGSAALEASVMALAAAHPEYVVREA